MDSNKISNWLQVAGNFGLLAGLVLVAFQINQNTNLARTDMVSRNYESSMMFGLAMMGEDPAAVWSKAALDPDSLTDHDLTRIQFMVDFWWNYHDRLDYLEEKGWPKKTGQTLSTITQLRRMGVIGPRRRFGSTGYALRTLEIGMQIGKRS